MMLFQVFRARRWNFAGYRGCLFRAGSLKISLLSRMLNIAPSAPRSGFPTSNLERRQMPGDIVGIESRAGESANGAGRIGGSAIVSQRRFIQVRPEHRLGYPDSLGADRGLPPAHHLRIKPGGLHGIGPGRAL